MTPVGALPVEPYFEDKDAGQRVDKVLNKLAESVERDISEEVRGRTTSDAAASSLFFYSFEQDIEEWIVVAEDDDDYEFSPFGRTGGRTLRPTGELHRAFPAGIPFDEERRYRLRGRFRRVSGSGTGAIYFGWQVLSGDAETVVATHWLGVNGQSLSALPAGSWQQYRSYIQGHSTFGSTSPSAEPDNPATVHQDARYFRPIFHVDAPAGMVVDIDYIAVEVVPEREEVDELLETVADNPKQDVSITINIGGGVADNMVSEGAIQTDAVRANHIRAGEVDADHISSISLSVLQAEVGVLSELAPGAGIIVSGRLEAASDPVRFIDLDATGSQAFISHDNFAVYADGSAIFMGELIAASGTFAGDLDAAGGTFAGIVEASEFVGNNFNFGIFQGDVRGRLNSIAAAISGGNLYTVELRGQLESGGNYSDFWHLSGAKNTTNTPQTVATLWSEERVRLHAGEEIRLDAGDDIRLDGDDLHLLANEIRIDGPATLDPSLVSDDPVEFLHVRVGGNIRYIPLHDDGAM